jgi:hypothetical protein
MEDMRRDNRDLLSILRLSTSRAFTRSDLARKVLEAMSEGIVVSPNDYHFILCDNLQFKSKANHDPTKIGIKQTTKIIDVVIPAKMLAEVGILSDDGSSILLSTEPSNSWEELREENGAAERLTAVTSEYIDALTECVAESILTAIEDGLNGNLAPGKKRLRTERFIDRQTKGELLSRSGVDLSDMNAGDVEAMIGSEEGASNRNTGTQATIVAQIVQKDLARTSTIEFIADYMIAVQEMVLSKIEDPAERANCLMSKMMKMSERKQPRGNRELYTFELSGLFSCLCDDPQDGLC